jgi:oxazoline/thiazoline synthase
VSIDMAATVLLRPRYHVEVLDSAVFLVSERDCILLSGSVYSRVVPLLDGTRTEDEVVAALHGLVSPSHVYYAIGQLIKKDYAVTTDRTAPCLAARFWDALGCHPTTAVERIRAATVDITAVGDISIHEMARALEAAQLRVGADGELGVVVTDDYLQPGLAQCNADALSRARPWLLVKPVGGVLWIGPLFQPGRGPCWECLAERMHGHRRVETFLERRLQRCTPLPAQRGRLDASVAVACNLAALQAARWLAEQGEGGETPRESDAQLVTVDLSSMATRIHHIARRPQCHSCGPAATSRGREPTPITLQSCPKRYTEDGGHRTRRPDETLAMYEHTISPVTGIVSTLDKVSLDESHTIRYYVAAQTSPRRADSLSTLRGLLREVSAGKGATDAQARASALCEALERYSGYAWGDEPWQLASLDDIGPDAVHPNSCMLFSDAQYDTRDHWNQHGSIYEVVPRRLDRETVIPWTPVWSVDAERFRYLPTELCYAHFHHPSLAGGRYCLADSNGNAAGNTMEEAILQGFFELVERDSVAIWWYNRVSRPGVDLSSFADGFIDELVREYGQLGRRVWVLDLATDLGVPAFAAISRRVDGGPEEICWGFGAHVEARIGVLRALTEMCQNVPRATVDGGRGDPDPRVAQWYANGRLDDHPFLAPAAELPHRVAHDYPTPWSDDLRDDVLRCRDLVRSHGMDLLVLDQTRADVELPVVKVIVPGLRHIRPRFAPGRLYDVPIRLGWRRQPLAEHDLNPLPYIFP